MFIKLYFPINIIVSVIIIKNLKLKNGYEKKKKEV